MTDRYERIRAALAKGPTPGPWEYDENADGSCPLVYGANETPVLKFDQGCPYDYDPSWDVRGVDAAYIAACDPDTIRALLEERDAQQAEIEALRAEVERLRADRDSWEQQASDRVADWHAEHLRAEQLAEALRESHGEVLRLRAAMFRVYATAANGGNPTMYIEQMRDEMDKPWSGDKASAALEQESGRG